MVRALDVITDGDSGLKISTRRVTVSTAGLVPKLADLGVTPGSNLAISLNATDDDTRARLMPINRKYPWRSCIDGLPTLSADPGERSPLNIS